MKKIKKGLINLWKDESGQGTAEYVLILVAVIAVGYIFKPLITKTVEDKMKAVKDLMDKF